MKNKKGEQRRNNKATSIISLILLIIFMGGIIGGLGWATKGFKDKSFGNLTDIVDGYIKKQEKSNPKKGKESENGKKNRLELSNGIDVVDYANVLDVKYMQEKNEPNELCMAPIKANMQNDKKTFYMSFRQWPEKFAVEKIKASLVFHESGETVSKWGKPITNYVELENSEFKYNEFLKVNYKKAFDEYIDLKVTVGEKEYVVKLGCLGDDVDLSTLDWSDNVVYDLAKDKYQYNLLDMMVSKDFNFGTEKKVSYMNKYERYEKITLKGETAEYDTYRMFVNLCMAFDELETKYKDIAKIAKEIDIDNSLFEKLKKLTLYREYKYVQNMPKPVRDQVFNKLKDDMKKDKDFDFLKNGILELKIKKESRTGMKAWLNALYQLIGCPLSNKGVFDASYYNYAIMTDKDLTVSDMEKAIQRGNKKVGCFVSKLTIGVKVGGEYKEITINPKKIKGRDGKVEEITPSFNENNYMFG